MTSLVPSAAPAAPLLAAIGVLSGGGKKYEARRAVLRQAWVADPPSEIAVRFVMRCGGLPPDARERHEPQVLCTNVLASEDRFRGPILALLAWYEHAEHAFPTARLFGKADDDVYLHLPTILRQLAAIPVEASSYALYGTFSWWHLLHEPGRRFHFAAYAPRQSFIRIAARRCGLVERCNEPNISCWGPFPYPNGPFFALGRKLAAQLVRAPGIDWDRRAFDALPANHGMIVEDAWLGSALWRHVGYNAPVELFKLGSYDRVYSDNLRFKVSNDVAIYHFRCCLFAAACSDCASRTAVREACRSTARYDAVRCTLTSEH